MVRIEFLGAWKDEDVQAVRDVTVTGIEKNLKISVLPAYFEEEYSSIEENCLAFSENCMRNGKIAPVECDEEITKNIALKTGISKDNISVTLDAPPQERRSYAEER